MRLTTIGFIKRIQDHDDVCGVANDDKLHNDDNKNNGN